MRYAEVAVELPVPGTYHYEVPGRWASRPLVGSRVLVPFGRRGVTGVVVGEADTVDADNVKVIEDVLDDAPTVGEDLLGLCLWVASYYEAPPGEVLRAAMPVGSRLTAARYVRTTEEGEAAAAGRAATALARIDLEVLGAVVAASGTIAHKTLARGKGRAAAIADLAERGLLELASTRSKPRVREKTVRVARLARALSDDDRDALGRAPARRAVVDALTAAGGEADVAALKAAQPRAAAHMRELVKTGLVEVVERVVRRDSWREATDSATASAPVVPPTLTAAQAAALAAIGDALAAGAFQSFLLHGITGSGKTEVYLHAIADVVAAGKTAIVLVPEISLTPQLAARFRARFGDQVAVLHSGLGDGERFDEWHRLRSGSARIALGARSAIFAPVENLGIVVVDEEHDSSFKQEEGVRYSARDVALVRAQRAGAPCVLGSATPSFETFHAAQTGRYQLLSLPERATSRPLPKVELIDLRTYKAEGDAMLTAPLAEAIATTLAAKEQVILFLNRRGFSTFVVCAKCGAACQCPQCSVSLTYHRRRDRLVCHYCGHDERASDLCPTCNARSIVRKGIGTEKVADAVEQRFPNARVARLDRDTAAGAGLQDILGRVARREVDILVGTQMVTKGHDFPGVTLVGVLCADTGLSLPDFRAAERTFQLLTQVAGRAGRGDRPGRVLVQSYRTDATAVAAASEHDYVRFFRAETVSRKELGYPPFGHLIALRIDGRDGQAVAGTARELERVAASLRGAGSVRTLGPIEAPLARLKGRTRWHMWLRGADRKAVRAFCRDLVRRASWPASVRVAVDVDPVSTL